MREVLAGSTNHTEFYLLVDSTTGLNKTGLLYSDMSAAYTRAREASVDISVVTLASVTTAWTSGGFIEVDATKHPGLYRFDIPNAAFVSGVENLAVTLRSATIKSESKEFRLIAWDKSTQITPDVYHADIDFTRDQNNSQDEWTVTWFKNGLRVTSGITSPTIQLIKRVDGTDLLAATAMTQIGSTGSYKKDEATSRVTLGEAVIVVVSATIDGSSRSWVRNLGRDAY